ncbi:MAG: hypothetical protein AB1555_06140 [Nitrospirota bacterium]
MTEQRKWQALVALGVAWVALITMRWMTAEDPQQVPLRFTSGQPVAPTRSAANGQVIVKPIRTKAHQAPIVPKRNIFAPYEPPAAPISRSAVARATLSTPPAAAVSQPTPKPVTPPPPSPEELAAQQAREREEQKRKHLRERLAQYRYFGYLTRDGERRAFIGKDREIYIIRLGDTLDGAFLVASIDGMSVRLKDPPTGLEVTIQLAKEGSGGPS